MRERRASLMAVGQAALEAPPASARRGIGAGAGVRRWCRSWLGAGLGLILLCLTVYLPGLWSIPPVDRDESRFAQASRQMVQTGDYVLPRVQERPRLSKPPLIYWLQAGLVRAAGDAGDPAMQPSMGESGIWLYRVPSVVCAVLSVLVTWRLGLLLMDARAAALGAALLGVCPMVVWDAHQARADQLLLLTAVGAMHAMAALWRRWGRTGEDGGRRAATAADWGWALALWAWVGAGVLAKGPITPMVVVLSALAMAGATRSWGWLWRLRPWLGVIVVVGMAWPWVAAVMGRVGAAAYWGIVRDETLGRSADPAEGHWGPPGYHLLLLTPLLWPGSLVTAGAFVWAWRRTFGPKGTPGRRRLRAVGGTAGAGSPSLLLLAWIVPSWIVFELVATKLPHYTLPLYPALALLSARVAAGASGRAWAAAAHGRRLGVTAWGIVGTLGLCGSLVLLALKGGLGELVGPESALGAGISSAVLVWVLVLLAAGSALRGRLVRAMTLGALAVGAWSLITLGAVLPRCRDLWIGVPLAQSVETLTGSRTSPVALVGYEEDSLVFLLGGPPDRVQRVPADGVSNWIKAHPGGVVVVDVTREPDAAKAAGARLGYGARVEGFNYSLGRRVVVVVYAPVSSNPRLR